ncbi:MAG: hypothetical protein IPH09_06965 [bacterium]|nr:hypothetical protein [bacterium]
MNPTADATAPPARRLRGTIADETAVSSSMRRLDLELEEPVAFQPGQFCMLNLAGERALVFGRPFSLLAASGRRLSLLYKVVGRGTARLRDAGAGAPVTCLTPLGRPFPAPDERPRLLLAGGVGLPPLIAWAERWGRPRDLRCAGGRDGDDLPRGLLGPGWRLSADRPAGEPGGRPVFAGNVVELARSLLPAGSPAHVVLACGPLPLLRAAAGLAGERGWDCLVSVEERMGCGYGVCRGCVVPRAGDDGYATACKDGPVFDARALDWARFGGEVTA